MRYGSKEDRDAAKGFWANGKFVKYADLQRDAERGFAHFVNANPVLRGHMLPKGQRPQRQNQPTPPTE